MRKRFTSSPSLERPDNELIAPLWASTLRTWWDDHRDTILRIAVVLMAVVALVWLGYQSWRLLWESPPIWPSSPVGAVDLRQRHTEVHAWFDGRSVYKEIGHAVYPPASYVILRLLLGWLELTPARWLWAATTVVALGWLAYLTVRQSSADTPLERVFAAMMPLSMYATGAAIGNGQLIVHILPMLVTGLLLLHRGQRRWHTDLLASAFILLALVQPTISAPFFWIVVFIPDRMRPAWMVGLGYVALSLLATSFQGDWLIEPLHDSLGAIPIEPLYDWTERGLAGAKWGSVRGGTANLHNWLTSLGLEEWNLPASLLVLMAFGFWTYRHRYGDLWLLMGVTALVARFWTYHRWYDDLLILLPMIALFRIAKQGPSADGGDVVAGVLLAITMLTTLAPGGLYLFPSPWNTLYVAGQVFVWIVVLIFLLHQTNQEKVRGSA